MPRSRRHGEETIRVRDAASYFHDEELAFGFHDEELTDEQVVRVGRGLTSAKKASAGAVKEDRETAAFKNRGRKTERVWS